MSTRRFVHTPAGPRANLPVQHREWLQVLGWYLLAAVFLQALASPATGLQIGRHFHPTGDRIAAWETADAVWKLDVSRAVHSHDGHEHSHIDGDALTQPLGEQDASSLGGSGWTALLAAPWPALWLWSALAMVEQFGPAALCSFSSRCIAVPLKPPRG